MKITDIRHPDYTYKSLDWLKYRLIKMGGDPFIDEYLMTFSTREDAEDFKRRRKITYNPAFAKSSIEEIKNAIFQRITDVRRLTNNQVYNEMVVGQRGGVNRKGTTMNNFMGLTILPELAFLGKVGVYVDMPELTGTSVVENFGKTPYMYHYRAEDILSWQTSIDDPADFQSVLLRENVDSIETTLVSGTKERYRHCYIQNGQVHVDFYDESGQLIDKDFNLAFTGYVLDIPKIPFCVFELSESLLVDAANYQIALLNLASSDMSYAVQANFPFYVEQTDFVRSNAVKLPGEKDNPGESTSANARGEEVNLGVTQGRKYGKGMDAPQFIHPSPEPLKASMDKQEQLRHEVRTLVHLSLSNVMSKSASAESKGVDNQGLESGLSYIALELEAGERKIAEHTLAYLNVKDIVEVKYPTRYNLQTEDERLKEIEAIEKRIPAIPSKTYQRAMAKELVLKLLGHKISENDLQKIYQEIDESPAIISNPDTIIKDVEAGILSHETAAKIRLYPEGEAEAAEAEHVKRLEEIASHQQPPGGVRGVNDLNPGNPSKEDKKGTDKRGEGKFTPPDNKP